MRRPVSINALAQSLRLPNQPSLLRATPNVPVTADFIVALVNSEPVTNNEVRQRMRRVEQQMAQQGVAVPPREQLAKQVLEQLLTERALLQHATETGIRVDEATLLRESGWYDYWGYPFGYYRDIFALARQHRLPLRPRLARVLPHGDGLGESRRQPSLHEPGREKRILPRLQVIEDDLPRARHFHGKVLHERAQHLGPPDLVQSNGKHRPVSHESSSRSRHEVSQRATYARLSGVIS